MSAHAAKAPAAKAPAAKPQKSASAAGKPSVSAPKPSIPTQSSYVAAGTGSVHAGRPFVSLEDGLLSRESFGSGKKGVASNELSDSLQALAAKLSALAKGGGS
jgi:hypothetical protein